MEIKNSNEKIIIGAAYFQPTDDVPAHEYLQHVSTVEQCIASHPDHKVIVMGDYDLPRGLINPLKKYEHPQPILSCSCL